MRTKLTTPFQALRFGCGAFAAALLAFGLGASAGLHAQTVFRIVNPDGSITFSDKPPINTAPGKQTVTASTAGGRPLELANNSLPFDLRQVAQRYPVTLYTAENCAPCGSGRTLLSNRGIPFAERTVSTPQDNEALQRISGENSLPFLTIGGQKIKGFSDNEWIQFLDAAGYPISSKLPPTYRNAAATPLVALQRQPDAAAQAEAAQQAAARAAAEKAAAESQNTPAPAETPNPTGIRF